MDRIVQLLTSVDRQAPDYSTESLILSLLLSFVLGQFLAWVYTRTHSGLSYSRSFTQSLVLMMMVVSLVMFIIGNNIVTAFGLIGALALIRFRNVLKDTRDTVFVFFSLVLGMAAGSQRYSAAIIGTAALAFVAFYLYATAFGSVGRYDGHLTCHVDVEAEDSDLLSTVLRRFCRGFDRVSTRRDEQIAEYIYQVRLRDRGRGSELTEQLRHLEGVGGVVLIMRDEVGEV